MKIILKTIVIGIAGAFATDVWTLILKLFGVHSHGLLLVGQWILFHLSPSLQKQLLSKELIIGWTAHYCLGVAFAFFLILLYGKKWFQKPSVFIALIFALTTFIISLFIIQPILGFGVAFSKFQTQPVIVIKVLVFHNVYSAGLYVATKFLKTNSPINANTERIFLNQ